MKKRVKLPPLTDEQSALSLTVIPLAVKLVAKALRRRGVIDPDLVLDIAHDAVTVAVLKWDPSRAMLSTCTGWYVRAALRDHAIVRKRTVRAVSFGLLMDAEGREEGETYDPEDADGPAPDASLLHSERLRLLELVKRRLPPLWFAALWLTAGLGLTLDAAGQRMGISHERVRQLRNAALAMARRSTALRKAVAS